MANDDNYLYARAEAELNMARRAVAPEAVKAHYVLAGHYLDRFYQGQQAAAASSSPIAPGGRSAA